MPGIVQEDWDQRAKKPEGSGDDWVVAVSNMVPYSSFPPKRLIQGAIRFFMITGEKPSV
jgi:hypothetical protein